MSIATFSRIAGAENQSSSPLIDADLADFLDILQLLIREPSVVGTEDSFFRVLRRELEEVGARVQYYQGVLVAQGSRPYDLILSAHIDRHGLLCTGPNEFQYAAFIASNRCDLTGDSVSEQMMYNIGDRFAGQRVQAHLPYAGTYLGQASITRSYVCPQRHNLIFELNGLEFLQPGTPISFLDRLKIENGFLSAQLDNVLSVAMLVHMFRKGFRGTCLFTAQEEAGRSWRYALEWFKRQHLTTQKLIVVDTSPFPDTLSATAQQLVLRRKDASGEFAPGITDELQKRCEALGVTTMFKDAYIESQNVDRSKPLSLGRTELGRLVAATDGEINGTTLQIPTTGYHTAEETASLDSVAAAIQLLSTFL
ncbi:peptidase M42 [Blastopirellula sp. JC732]|uniref:Peptidase M42 n=1 Tax=Blastopirellula sediminis TaxID=2894196 RepID=A0A9X1SFL0_9BACT|nr:peptidase M42 [Blastopirellula sediminis]MCC9608785.1 peptidase M42 [Blastopirellula sediminis]MCC9628438.1 peptidase M42 [Blastopirellula sediminis]